MKRGNVTIRMGAAAWDVTIHDRKLGDTRFDLRAMGRHQRGRFYGQFMSAVRKSFRQQPRRAAA